MTLTDIHLVSEQTYEDPTLEFVDITPEMAEAMLGSNIENNRHLIQARVGHLIRDIRAGHWLNTAESIKFDTAGRLIDGQHRLAAIHQSQITTRMLVARGLHPDVIRVIDTGSPRTIAQALTMSGADLKNVSVTVGAAQLLNAWDMGAIISTASHVDKTNRLTSTEAVEYILDNVDTLQHAAAIAMATYSVLRIPPTSMAAAYVLCARVAPESTATFFSRIIEGRRDGNDDPLSVIDRRVADDRYSGRRIPQAVGMFYIIRAWNAWRDDKPIAKMLAGIGGARPTAMPTPH